MFFGLGKKFRYFDLFQKKYLTSPIHFPIKFHKIGYAAEWVALSLDVKISSTVGLFAKRVSGSRGGQWCESGVALEGGNSAQLARHHNQPVTQAVTQLSHKLSHIFSH